MKKKPDIKPPKKMGRPTLYTPELAKQICETIASNEKGLCHLVDANPHWPDRAQIFVWRRKHAEFRAMYTEAKKDQVEVSVEYMQELMAEPHRYINEKGISVLDVPMLRAKMDAVKWQAAKLEPRKYGDIKGLDIGDSELDEDIKKRYAEMDAKNKKEY